MRIGFIGAGKMAQALARGLINSGRHRPERLMASCPETDAKLLDECKALGIRTTHDNAEVTHESDVVVVAVKPPHVSRVASEIAPAFRRDQLLVSIALGITLRYIENVFHSVVSPQRVSPAYNITPLVQLLPAKSRVARAMPNTPAVVACGASAYCMGAACRPSDAQTVEQLLSTVGYAVQVPEAHLDPITGLSGSGPSYVFSMIEGMTDGGVKEGLPRDLSLMLTAYTFMGAAKMVLETGEHPAVLKEAVQSPGGSTVYGIHELEKGALRALLINAVEAGARRARSMGQELALPQRPKISNTQSEQEKSEED